MENEINKVNVNLKIIYSIRTLIKCVLLLFIVSCNLKKENAKKELLLIEKNNFLSLSDTLIVNKIYLDTISFTSIFDSIPDSKLSDRVVLLFMTYDKGKFSSIDEIKRTKYFVHGWDVKNKTIKYWIKHDEFGSSELSCLLYEMVLFNEIDKEGKYRMLESSKEFKQNIFFKNK
jgi:hypothetical protein